MTNKDNQPTEIKNEADLDRVQGAGMHKARTTAPLVRSDKEELGLTADDGSETVRKPDLSLYVWKTEEGKA